MLRYVSFIGFLGLTLSTVVGQADCPPMMDEIDPFDSLRTVSTADLTLGNQRLTLVETEDGPGLAPEAKAMVMYSQTDSLGVIFLHLELPEYQYVRSGNGYNIRMMMSDSSVIGLYTISDRGTFNRGTNMRHYQHTGLVPMDHYYQLTSDTVALLRVEYQNHRRTIPVSPHQAGRLREYFRCLGERVGFYPVKP